MPSSTPNRFGSNQYKIRRSMLVDCTAQLLTTLQREHLSKAVLLQCAIQHDDSETAPTNLLEAVRYAQGRSQIAPLPTIADILELGALVKPIHNSDGYRRIPVVFDSGASGTPPTQIPAAIDRLIDQLNATFITNPQLTDEWVYAFLSIHPFQDGNGRCAWILYNWLSKSIDYPINMPEYFSARGDPTP